jgi:ACS family glucarate transporter-like MFS transporter
MAAELGLSRMELGVVLSGFAWGYALLQFPGGIWGDRLSARRALPIIAVWWGLLNLLVAFVPGRVAGSVVLAIGVLTVLRFLMGAAQAPLFPIIGGGTTCKWFPVSGWALPNALQNFGLTFGAAATAPLIVWLMDRAGWRGSFLLTGPAAFLLAAAWWWYMRDRPSAHPGVNAQERELIEAGRSAAELAAAEPGGWRAVLGNRQVQVIALGYFCANYLFYFFFNWLFVYLIEARGFKLLEEAGRPQSPAGLWLVTSADRRIEAEPHPEAVEAVA